jgi:integrase
MHLIFQQYLERLERRQAKPNTLRNMRRTAALYEESGLDPLTARDWEIEEWLAGLQCPRTKGGDDNATPLALRTVRLHAENLSAVYGYTVLRGLLPVSPMETVKLPREPDKEPRILEPHELRQLLGQAITETQWLLLHTLMYTGMRRAEIRHLKWEDISPTSIKVIGKGDKLRHIPLHPALAEVIITHTDPKSPYAFAGRGEKPMSDSGIDSLLHKVTAGVACSFHDFRRTVATSLAENDVPEGIIDRIMGWAPRTVGRRYYIRRADHRMQEAILRLYADNPLVN